MRLHQHSICLSNGESTAALSTTADLTIHAIRDKKVVFLLSTPHSPDLKSSSIALKDYNLNARMVDTFNQRMLYYDGDRRTL